MDDYCEECGELSYALYSADFGVWLCPECAATLEEAAELEDEP